MSNRHGVRQQKRLAKQKSKRQSKHRKLAALSSPDPDIRLKSAEHWPVIACWVPGNLREAGLGQLLIARRMPDGQLACAMFLVDVFCLGIKNALWTIVAPGRLSVLRRDLEGHGPIDEVTPEHFAKLIYRAADYGQSLGFAPHRDFRHAQRLLAGIDPSLCPDEFEFGRDGQPLYIRGPFESVEESQIIAARVQALGGDYIVPLKPSEAPFDPWTAAEALDDENDDHTDEYKGDAEAP